MAYLNNPKRYTVIPQNILTDKRLCLRDRGMLTTLISLPDKWNFSTRGLCKLFPDGLTAVTSAVQSLEKLGYLKRTQLFNERGKFSDVRWDIITEPEISEPEAPTPEDPPAPEEPPCTENPYTGNPDTGNASTENPPQYNINTSNTKEVNINQSLCKKESVRPPEKKRSSYNEIIAGYTNDSALHEALGDYIAMRKMKRLPVTNKGLLLLLADLDKLATDTAQKIIIVNEATMRSWTKFFPLKKDTLPTEQPSGSFETKDFFDLALKRSYGKNG